MTERAGEAGWGRAQALVALVTAIVGVGLSVGQYQLTQRQNRLKIQQDTLSFRVNQKLAAIKAEQETVAAVAKYFPDMAAADTSLAKMAAYAIYMLRRDDPEMVVSLILASGKPSLRNSVLADLANRDSAIKKRLVDIAAPRSDTSTSTPEYQNVRTVELAESVLSQISNEGWVYAGIFRENRWTHGPMLQVGAELPVPGREYRLGARTLYLRDAAPDDRTYRHGAVCGIVNAGQRIRITEVRRNIHGRHVWVRVAVLGGVEQQL